MLRSVQPPAEREKRVVTMDVIRSPSKAVSDLAKSVSWQRRAEARDKELAASYGGERVTYGVWRAGPVPPSWRPPPEAST